MAESQSLELFASELENQIVAAHERLESAEDAGDELLAEVERQHVADLERLAEANDVAVPLGDG